MLRVDAWTLAQLGQEPEPAPRTRASRIPSRPHPSKPPLVCELLKRHGVGIFVTERTVEGVAVDEAIWESFE